MMRIYFPPLSCIRRCGHAAAELQSTGSCCGLNACLCSISQCCWLKIKESLPRIACCIGQRCQPVAPLASPLSLYGCFWLLETMVLHSAIPEHGWCQGRIALYRWILYANHCLLSQSIQHCPERQAHGRHQKTNKITTAFCSVYLPT